MYPLPCVLRMKQDINFIIYLFVHNGHNSFYNHKQVEVIKRHVRGKVRAEVGAKLKEE